MKTISLVDNGILGNFAHIHSVQNFPSNNCQHFDNFKDKQRLFRLINLPLVEMSSQCESCNLWQIFITAISWYGIIYILLILFPRSVADFYTVCPRSSDPFYFVTYYIKWVITSWTYSITLNHVDIETTG